MPLPEGADESHFLGALFGEGIEVVPAETVDLLVPATAEIVIEGHIAFDETVMEGPMNEYPGYNATRGVTQAASSTSRAITHRDGAILPVVAAGPPVEEDHTVTGTMHAAEILYQLREAGLPVASDLVLLRVGDALADRGRPLRLARRRSAISSAELAHKIGDVVFAGKAGSASRRSCWSRTTSTSPT